MARLPDSSGHFWFHLDDRTIDQGGPNAAGWHYSSYDFGIDPARHSVFNSEFVRRALDRGYLGKLVDDPIDEDV